jgi:hypothetical protein
MEQAASLPGLHGAYFAGSANELPDDALLPPTSDLDINLVLTDPDSPSKRGKLIYRGVLLDIVHISPDRLRSAEAVLSDYHLAGGVRTQGMILAGGSGHSVV